MMFYAPVLFKTLGNDDSASLLNTVIVGPPCKLPATVEPSLSLAAIT